MDETWIQHNTPQNEKQSKQWTVTGELAPKKGKAILSAYKVLVSVFWDARGNILDIILLNIVRLEIYQSILIY